MSDGRALEIPGEALGALCRRYGVRELYLIGSVPRGELGPGSDVDLLVSLDADAPAGFLAAGRLHQPQALRARAVDVAPKAGLKPPVRSEVLAQDRVSYAT